MRLGESTITKLIETYPGAEAFFGPFLSPQHFELVLLGPMWTVLEEDECWMLVEFKSPGIGEVHWFCPAGANTASIRKMLNVLFASGVFTTLQGTVPPDHLSGLKARILNRAVGAVKENGVYVLTKERFLAYNSERFSDRT